MAKTLRKAVAGKKRGAATKPKPALERQPALERRQQIIVKAAKLFGSKGFDATSMRDIGSSTGMIAGSLYYHFASKEELFMAVHAEGMKVLINAAKNAIKGLADPWERLEAASVAHCSALFDSSDLMVLVVPTLPTDLTSYRAELIQQRDEYEMVFRKLVTALKLPAEIDENIFRLNLIGALNWTRVWFKVGGHLKIEEVGLQIVREMRVVAIRPALKPRK